MWPDSTVDDYLYRDDALEDLCLYEFVTFYSKDFKKFKEMNISAHTVTQPPAASLGATGDAFGNSNGDDDEPKSRQAT